jgi:non-ribosomal peptide synthetase component F
MLVGLLGILKTGSAYVPLDSSYPADRIRFTLEDADPVVLLTQRKLLARFPTHRAATVMIDADWNKISRESGESPATAIQSGERLYVLYTSGSSGRPKGVEGTHGGALNRFEWMWGRYPI